MRPLSELKAYRDRHFERQMSALMGTAQGPDDFGGCFFVRSPVDGMPLKIIASACMGGPDHDLDPPFDHVSISRKERCPTWEEMEHVKRLFFLEHEVAMQLHVPPSDHISFHPHCLHIWRPTMAEIPMPPSWMVA